MSFDIRRVKSKAELDQLHALRYQVYCLERKFLDAVNYPDEQERDEFDPAAIQIAAFDPNSAMVGGLRLVRSTSMHFPIFDHCKIDKALMPKKVSSLAYAEISRLIISKKKRDLADKVFQSSSEHSRTSAIKTKSSDFAELGLSSLLMDLFQVMFVYSKKRHIKYWFAAMEPSLMRLLKRFHFNFQPIGPATDYYGQVVPCIASLDEIETQVATHDMEFYQQFAKHLVDADKPHFEETMWPYPRDLSVPATSVVMLPHHRHGSATS